ncbi:hypothetical protein [Teichococcus oryzae]|uniref:Uncharacterized protein n=1 Tax=Teichococcus oryzae TaxID=1608942 RepID=A0A5B2TH80_9PROT|nr:hypothetical protein [Pseudoroseomonas oryzae]KAA2213837.1 hypothetical protein F0Q34_07215 [Pseudoroseomonas oryzae]
MRFLACLIAAALLPGFVAPALAQSWPNETGPAGDLLTSSGRQFDRLRQAAPGPRPGGFAAPDRPVVPMLDWAPPVAQPPAPAPRRVATPRRAPAAAPAPASPAAATPTASTRNDWERSLAERERELEALRRRLEEDRRLFGAQAPARPDAPRP